MANNLLISSYASIVKGQAWENGRMFYNIGYESGFSGYSRLLYKKLDLLYPKFFKMDNLCKLAILTSELLWHSTNSKFAGDGSRMAVVLSNSSSSLDTDRTFYESINDADDYFPSPAVFVYTLPNIAIGELCIKNKITGENAFLIFEKFDETLLYNYVSELLNNNRADACICGWCNFDQGFEESFFMMIQKENAEEEVMKFNPLNIKNLYKKIS